MKEIETDIEFQRRSKRRRRPKLVRQREAEDCGAAALATVCGYFGSVPPLNQLRSLTNVGIDGTSLYCLARAAGQLGLDSSGVEVSFSGLMKIQLPAITTIGYHFVVIDSADKDGVMLGDPALGWRRVPRDEFCREWSGALLLFNPTSRFSLKPDIQHRMTKRMWRLVSPFGRPLLGILLLTLLMNVAALSLPVLTQILVDRHFHGSDKIFAALLAAAATALSVCAVLEGVRHLLVTRVSARLQLHVGGAFLDHLLSLPLPYFLTRHTGDSVNRVDEIQRLSHFIGSQGAEALVDVVLAALSLGLVFYYSSSLGFLLFGLGASLLTVALWLGPLIYKRLEGACQLQVDATTLFIESVRKVALLKSCQAEGRWAQRWRHKTAAANRAIVSAENLCSALAVATQFVFRATPLAAVLIGLREGTALSIGALVSVSSIISVSLSSMLRLSSHYLEAQKVMLGMERILDVLEERPERTSDGASLPLERDRKRRPPRITLRGVGFQYGDQSPLVLSGLDLMIEPGATVALVGRSGSGKSTLAQLLCGLLRPIEGEILLDGENLNRIPLRQLRQRVAIVAQDCPLIRGTILDNITLFDNAADRARAVKACRMAQAEEFIAADPLGYDRVLNEDGTGLSAGQRQRIAIARALYVEPDVLILDEPTSALDAQSEKSLMSALRGLQGSLTLVLIAHRLQTLRQVDRIFVVEDGRVAESGSPDELLAQDGRYQALSRASEEHRAQEWVQ